MATKVAGLPATSLPRYTGLKLHWDSLTPRDACSIDSKNPHRGVANIDDSARTFCNARPFQIPYLALLAVIAFIIQVETRL